MKTYCVSVELGRMEKADSNDDKSSFAFAKIASFSAGGDA
eukprot:SAG31_NODE_120_length_23892_cov_10.545623_8_plen_40_part_00